MQHCFTVRSKESVSSETHRHNNSRGRVQSARSGQTSASLQPCSGIATSWQGWWSGHSAALVHSLAVQASPLADGLFAKLAVLTVMISGVKIMGIYHYLIKRPPLCTGLEARTGWTRAFKMFGCVFMEKSTCFPYFKKLNDFVNLSPNQRYKYSFPPVKSHLSMLSPSLSP